MLSLIKKYNDNKAIGEVLYLTAYIIFIIQILFQSTVYIDEYTVFNAILLPFLRNVSYIIILLKLGMDFISRRFHIWELFLVSFATLIFILVALYSGRKDILLFWLYIVAANNVQFKSIVSNALIIHIVFISFVIASSYAGIVSDRIFTRSEEVVRHSFGFRYSAQPAHYLFYTVLMWIYVRQEEISLFEITVMVVGILFMFLKTDTKNPFALSIIGLLGAVILKYSAYLRKYRKLYAAISILAVPFCASLMFILSYNDAWQGQEWMHRLDSLVTGRMWLANQGFHLFGFKPFGQAIDWFGGAIGWYHYVDSAYMNILFNLGWITFIMVVLWGAHCGYEASKHKDTYYVLAIALVAVHSMFDVSYAMIDYNVFITMYIYISNDKKKNTMEY